MKPLLVFLFITTACKAQIINVDTHALKKVSLVSCSPVKDQSMSSTCWSFAGNSFLESELLRKGISNIDLSEMYTARMAWVQKIKLHLQYKGKNFLTPGGQFHNIQWVLANYGMAPETAYNGLPQKKQFTHNHAALDTALTRYIAKLIKQKKKEPTAADWNYINQLLDKYVGKLPEHFSYEGEMVTPKEYVHDMLGIKNSDYAEITSYTHHPFYVPFVFENQYNFSYDKYMNVPYRDFAAITDSALQNGYTVLWNGDVTDDGFNFYNSMAFLEGTFTDTTEIRQKAFEDGSSNMDHMMHVVGLYTDDKNHKWYYIKNSWGTFNNMNGYLLMDENYFAIKTAAIVVNKAAIPKTIQQKLSW